MLFEDKSRHFRLERVDKNLFVCRSFITGVGIIYFYVCFVVVIVCLYFLCPSSRHSFVNNELIVKNGLVDKRKVSFLRFCLLYLPCPGDRKSVV